MPCSTHIEMTALLEHIDEDLKIWMFAAWVLAFICLIMLEFNYPVEWMHMPTPNLY